MYIFCFLRTGEAWVAAVERASSVTPAACSGAKAASGSGLGDRFIVTAEAASTAGVGDAALAATFALAVAVGLGVEDVGMDIAPGKVVLLRLAFWYFVVVSSCARNLDTVYILVNVKLARI